MQTSGKLEADRTCKPLNENDSGDRGGLMQYPRMFAWGSLWAAFLSGLVIGLVVPSVAVVLVLLLWVGFRRGLRSLRLL
jgi:ABC-type spermidine/putrescine transport system permease subunit II